MRSFNALMILLGGVGLSVPQAVLARADEVIE